MPVLCVTEGMHQECSDSNQVSISCLGNLEIFFGWKASPWHEGHLSCWRLIELLLKCPLVWSMDGCIHLRFFYLNILVIIILVLTPNTLWWCGIAARHLRSTFKKQNASCWPSSIHWPDWEGLDGCLASFHPTWWEEAAQSSVWRQVPLHLPALLPTAISPAGPVEWSAQVMLLFITGYFNSFEGFPAESNLR